MSPVDLMKAATSRINNGDSYFGSTDRFIRMAIVALFRSSGSMRLSLDEWNEDGTAKIPGYRVYVPELSPDGKERVCCGDSLQEALATAILTEEVIDV